MFPSRASEGDRNTLPPMSSLSSHDGDFARDSASGSRPLRTPLPIGDSLLDGSVRDRRPPSALDHHRTPPTGLLPRPQRDTESFRASPFPRPGEESYAAPVNPKFAFSGPPPPPPPFQHKSERGSPTSDEGAWRSYDRTDPRFGAKDAYSPRMPPAPYAPRDDARQVPWQRLSDDPHRPRMPAPPTAMRDQGPWRPSSASHDRADLHPDAFAHERTREEERWRDERAGRPMHPHETIPSHPSIAAYGQDVHSAGRPLDAEYTDDGRRIRRRANSGLVEDELNAQRYVMPGAAPYGPGTYSPPESRSQSAAPNQPPLRAGMMAGMDPPRPASAIGILPNAPASASNAPTQPPASTNAVNANRRVAHLLSEQKRRESINTGFEDLRQAIPACRDGQDSKATILKRALEYIRELESVVERQHRLPFDNHALGSYSNRSPPDDKDDSRRFGRPGGDEERRGSGRQMTSRGSSSSSSSSSSDAPNGPRIGGLPSNGYGGASNGYSSTHAPHHTRVYPPFGSPDLPPTRNAPIETARNALDATRSGAGIGPNGPVAKRWAEDTQEGQRSRSRRRVLDGDQDDVQRSLTGPHYMIAPAACSRSPLVRSPALEKPRDWHNRLDNKSLVDSAVRV